jgi:hypothetical protein
MKTNIETVVGHFFPDDKWLRQEVRNANGFVRRDFVCIPMTGKEIVSILNSLFGKRW